jgi:tellurite resistance protein
MEMQQILEIPANLKAKMNANQEMAEADRTADHEALNEMSTSMKSNQDLLARLEARIKTNKETDQEERKVDQEDFKRMMEEMNAKMDGNQAEMTSTVCATGLSWRRPSNMKLKP